MPTFDENEIPFGFGRKHRDKPIEQVPDGYLEWCLTIDLDQVLRNSIKKELMRRAKHGIIIPDHDGIDFEEHNRKRFSDRFRRKEVDDGLPF